MLHRIISNLKKYPEEVCYEVNGIVYRNRELYRAVCGTYRYLRENCLPKRPVVVCGQKEFFMLASFLACACAGIPYVPMEDSIPPERKQKILRQLQPSLVIDQTIEPLMWQENPPELTEICMGDTDVYYIIFTSGSTGVPKGVEITYSNLKSCMNWLESLCSIRGGVILNQASFSFDLSVADLYLSLLTRSKHFILERAVQKDYRLLFETLQNSHAELAVFTPSFLDLLLADRVFDARRMQELKTVLLCGEKLTGRTVEKLFARFPGIRLINCYGPTECTFAVTSAEITNPAELPIGTPKDDTAIYIVNEKLEEVPEGKTGEILIAGESVGKGYFNQKDEGRFLNYRGRNAFLSGDYGFRKHNMFYCLGRKDTQIKLNGYRIELSEIEAALNEIEQIEQAVVVAKKREDRVIRLLAFVKPRAGVQIEEKEIRECLKRILPAYMIPRIRPVKAFPLTANGKLDRNALMEDTE